MDRFKFRAWNGVRYWYEGEMNGFANYRTFMDKIGDVWRFIRCNKVIASSELGHVIEQCTGRKDTHDNLMYAGDIVSFTVWWFDGNVAETQLIGTIAYSPECMSFQLKGVKNKEWEDHTGYNGDQDYLTPFSELNFDEADFEIIGNVHENPELLEA